MAEAFHVIVFVQKPSDTVDDGILEARDVILKGNGAAEGCFDVIDAPAFLKRRIDEERRTA